MSKYGYDYRELPEHMRDTMERYIEDHIPTGSFLQAVLENNLCMACQRADTVNLAHLLDFVYWLYENAPSDSWGSEEKYANWIGADRDDSRGPDG